jgi:hypothetical protein
MGNMRLKATAAYHHGNEMRYINDGRRVPFSDIHDFAVQPNVYFDEVCMLYSPIRSYRYTVTMCPLLQNCTEVPHAGKSGWHDTSLLTQRPSTIIAISPNGR